MISQRAKYAFHALVALARSEGSLMVGEIAANEKIPRKFLEQILLELKRHGILQSRRGKFGGYGLLMPAGPIAPLPCLSRIAYRRCADCLSEESCEIKRVFGKVAEKVRDVLDRTTIADAIKKVSVDGEVASSGPRAVLGTLLS